MDSVTIYFGPKTGFDIYVNKLNIEQDLITSFSTLVRKSDERNREYKHIVNVSHEEIPQKEPINAEYLIAYSDEYSSVREHVILNFDGFISECIINNIILHNPPDLLVQKMEKIFPDTKVEYYEYPTLNESSLIEINSQYCQKIIGQENVLRKLLVSLIPLTRNDNNNPIVILFWGPSGVGKTETAKYLANMLGGQLFRKQLSMFQNNEFMTYLFGGHLYDKSFAKELLERETNVVLLDEFDKANTVFHSAFYQMFDEGVFEDKNYSAIVGNAVVICTSNYESLEHIREHLGDPIFSRFDACIQFEKLLKKDIFDIINFHIDQEWGKLSSDDQAIVSKTEIQDLFAHKCDRIYNARRIQSLVREVICTKVLNRILEE